MCHRAPNSRSHHARTALRVEQKAAEDLLVEGYDGPTKILPRILAATLEQSQSSTTETLQYKGFRGTPGGTRTLNLLLRSQTGVRRAVYWAVGEVEICHLTKNTTKNAR